jgi:anti-anti-sigma factor
MELRDELPFQLEVVNEDAGVRLVLSGELDAHAAQSFDRTVDEITGGGLASLAIDLANVTFIDSSGLRSLIRARKSLAPEGRVCLVSPQPGAMRLLEITGLIEEFDIS